MAKTLDELKTEANELGLQYAPNIKEAGLAKKIEAHRATLAPEGNVPPEAKEDSEGSDEDANLGGDDGEAGDGEGDKPETKPETKPALKPLNESATQEVKKEGPKWSSKSKNCLGSNASYPDDEENFPLYKTPKGDKNCYCKAFLDKKVKSGFIKVKKGVYVAVDPSKKK